MADTFRECWGRVLLRAPQASPLLAQDWVKNAFRRVAEKRLWSWLTGVNQMLFANETTAGTVTATFNNVLVVGNATAAAAWNAALIGQQFRVGLQTPLYTVTNVTTTTNPNDTLTLDLPWGGTSVSGVGYEIYNAYQVVPTDFFSFQSVIDPQMNWQLWANRFTQSDLNACDAQRASAGNPYAVVYRDTFLTAGQTVPLPRYEVWPHRKSQYCLPYLYVKRATDLSESGASLPRFIRGDVLVEGALADAARWPGVASSPNPYFNLGLARDHEARFQMMVGELEKQDDEVFEQDLTYRMFPAGLPWAPFPGDARFAQSHLLPSLGVA